MRAQLSFIVLATILLSSSLTHAQLFCEDLFLTERESHFREFYRYSAEMTFPDQRFAPLFMQELESKILLPDGSVMHPHELMPASKDIQTWKTADQNPEVIGLAQIPLHGKFYAQFNTFGRNLFLNAYFNFSAKFWGWGKREANGSHVKVPRLHAQQIAKAQPFLKWHEDTQRFSLEWKGSAQSILSTIAKKDPKNNLVIYRGLKPREIEPLKKAHLALKAGINEEKVLADFKAAGGIIGETIFFGHSLLSGQMWGRSHYLVAKLTIPPELWTKWSQNEEVYAGIEHFYAEIALMNDEAFLFYIKNMEYIDVAKPENPYWTPPTH